MHPPIRMTSSPSQFAGGPEICWPLFPELPRVVLVEISRCSHFANRYRDQFERAVNMRISWRGLP